MGDITARAIDVLSKVDTIFCEDTREAGKLCARFGFSAPLLSYHDHNREKAEGDILRRLEQKQRLALISDAGMPLISDPGYGAVRAAADAGYFITCLPGASAALTALVLSGLPTDRFFFAGFLSAKTAARQKELDDMARLKATLIFYETGPRLAESLRDMQAVLGDRPAAVARELTKIFEEVRRDALSALADHYDRNGAPKGEIVVLVGGAADAEAWTDDLVDQALRSLLKSGAGVKDAAAEVSAQSGRGKKDLYQRALTLKDEQT